MTEIILKIATTLSMTPLDVYVLAGIVLLWVFLLAIGTQKTYEIYFGLVVGLAIYLTLSVLLSPQYQTPDTVKIFSPDVSKFLISSSVYLIFILTILTPLSWGIRFPFTSNKFLRTAELSVVSVLILAFLAALVLGFASKTYIFWVDTGFLLLRKTTLYDQLMSGKILGYVLHHLQPIVLLGVLFFLYKLLFSEIAGALAMTLGNWVLSLRKRSAVAAQPESPPMEEFDEMEFPGHADHGHADHGHH